MTTYLPTEIQEVLGIQNADFLGGRLNKHWLVRAGGQKLVLRRWASSREDADYERDLRRQVSELGWPVARDVTELTEIAGALWSLAEFLPGDPHAEKNSLAELASRGRLMAEFHQSAAALQLERRTGWRLPDEILADDRIEAAFERCTDESLQRLLLWHLREARRLAKGLPWDEMTLQIIHGDFTPWNLLYDSGKFSGLLDCEMSRPDYRISEFALSWRGQYDSLIHAYNSASPLSDAEWKMLTPAWWALLLEGVYRNLVAGVEDDDWTARMLIRRSPLMGVENYPA